jgi:predicted RNA binding protein YcfA (HicA-like mRNA interferase family)
MKNFVWQMRLLALDPSAFLTFSPLTCYQKPLSLIRMNNRHRKTLQSVFSEPIPRSLDWSLIESLLLASGCELIEGKGSRVAFKHGKLRADFHRPHPGKEAKPYQVRAVREFLKKLEVIP